MAVNLDAVFRLCQVVGRVMVEQGHGKIINVVSLLAIHGGITVPAYAASIVGTCAVSGSACSNR